MTSTWTRGFSSDIEDSLTTPTVAVTVVVAARVTDGVGQRQRGVATHLVVLSPQVVDTCREIAPRGISTRR
ncbi:hypothetical protein D3C78_1393910 [compost metagenome]